MPSLTPLRNVLRVPATARMTPFPGMTRRGLRTTAPARMAYKDDQDRESLKPKAHEYTQSGTDEGAAAQSDAAFNPDKTSPETERQTAGAGRGEGNELESSPANKEFAHGGAANDEDTTKTSKGSKKSSGSGSPAKGGKHSNTQPGGSGGSGL
ncbi:hypothetical protein BKA67DRAFT_662744 [Truncatella angustata]|uniref:Uncharacterized protein n=1 Tax=Truncatella angustata TaxID=152316 RepID=A0A9P8UDN4_9PEZI|nr:uncharacterized protein BKA67DRAFT_662744 [Truncatella angustata]KAH6648007.1 hypothetical protein BKA67DRAFT_662744 [Truncatella angustata]KAH8194380.1 hypothetical protein TruAng_011463 [Truncatella angustata]